MSWKWKAFAIGSGILMLVLLILSSELQRRAAITKSGPVAGPERMIVTAEELTNAYEDNEVAADRFYKGKSIVVTGTVDNVGKDILNTMYVAMKGHRVWGVQCMFGDEHEGELASLRKGDKVTIIGTVRGKTGNVLLRDCDLR